MVRDVDISAMNKLLLPLVFLCVSLTCIGYTAEQIKECRQAAELGDAKAQYSLGGMYADGKGVAEDDAAAVKWFQKAAYQGDVMAQFSLGVMYADGEGVVEDYTEAVKWFSKAAEQGYAKAQVNLAVMYSAAGDYVTSYKWLNIAAAQGNERAKKGRGIIYKDMTKEQINEAQKLSREWLANYSK